ncbi:hypothetical protein [Thalassotalea litorea]|uniref:hypothetical protein n=1 Tax=Thalassotalea litorea TaxID=2020715 RepID=UPI003735EDA5
MSIDFRTYIVLVLVTLSLALSSVARAQVHVCAPLENGAVDSNGAVMSAATTVNNADTNTGSEHTIHAQHMMSGNMTAKASDSSDIASHDMGTHHMPCCDPEQSMSSGVQNHNSCGDCDMQSCGSSHAVLTLALLTLPQTLENRNFSQLTRRPPAPVKEWLIPPIR